MYCHGSDQEEERSGPGKRSVGEKRSVTPTTVFFLVVYFVTQFSKIFSVFVHLILSFIRTGKYSAQSYLLTIL